MEEWRNIEDFPGYQVSNLGRVRSFWRRKHYSTGYGCYYHLDARPVILRQSDDGNGYMKVMLCKRSDKTRYCKKVHRLVAEAFIEHDSCDDTVDHIQSGADGKKDNSVSNLRWIPRSENIKKAYRDGVCDSRIARQNKGIIATDIRTGKWHYFPSIGEAAKVLQVDRSSISHILRGDHTQTSHYTFEYAEREDDILYGTDENYQQLPWI